MTPNDITRGIFNRQRRIVVKILTNNWDAVSTNRQDLIQPQVMNYAKSMAKATELPIDQVLQSQPVKNYRDRMWFRI